jgi:hypothetical protein
MAAASNLIRRRRIGAVQIDLLPPRVSIDALRKVLPGCFRFAGIGGVEDRLAGIPFDEGPLMKCRRHGQDLCRPSFAGEAILNYRATSGAVALLVPQEEGTAAISSVLLGGLLR